MTWRSAEIWRRRARIASSRAVAGQQGDGDDDSDPGRSEQPGGRAAAASRGIEVTARRLRGGFQRGIDAWHRGLKRVGEIQEFLVRCTCGHGRGIWNGWSVGLKLG
jgi:hypothetical protein